MLAQAVCFHVLAVCAMLTSGDRGTLTVAHSAFTRTKHRRGDPFGYAEMDQLTDEQKGKVVMFNKVLVEQVDPAAEEAEASSKKLPPGMTELRELFGRLNQGVVHLTEVTQQAHKKVVTELRQGLTESANHGGGSSSDRSRQDLMEGDTEVEKAKVVQSHPPGQNKDHHHTTREVEETLEKQNQLLGRVASEHEMSKNQIKDTKQAFQSVGDADRLEDTLSDERKVKALEHSAEKVVGAKTEEQKKKTKACYSLAGGPDGFADRSCNHKAVEGFFKGEKNPCHGHGDDYKEMCTDTDGQCKIRFVCVLKGAGVTQGSDDLWEMHDNEGHECTGKDEKLDWVCAPQDGPCLMPETEQ
jgi:hypothetical protein